MSNHGVHHTSLPNRWTKLLAAVHDVRRAVHLRRRRVFPVTRLPNELLGHVFSLLADDDPPYKETSASRPRPFSIGWIKVTHVCRHWREVALDYSQLWAHIPLDMGREWTRELIVRAKHAPLAIYGKREAGLILPALVASGHLSHTRVLCIRDADLDVVHSMTTAAAPMLEHVTLELVMAGHYIVTLLPEDIFAFHAPRLRRGPLSTDFSIPRHIFNESPVPFLPSQRDFYDSLANMPHLESLIIRFALPSVIADTIEPQRRGSIALPHLRVLNLAGPWLDVVAILEVILFPALAVLHLAYLAEGNDGDPSSVIFPSLLRYDDMPPGIDPNARLLIAIRPRGWCWIYSRYPAASPHSTSHVLH
ncbi:hypothetical protein HETIRDRAFT_417520 [Heterobasidion irregulare TC 32-1]|uniref:F-box domain-containing protein n=1 Tax=Heterobasidion irregulare (strain TC 32-1) TaxID=747525 RepID=W4K7P8_HETIT|nr:uncharacterized protein HETIRDRAFT_417520 [Heterobasidion irregulare TC 32-1]ETW81375.1 hypothetical protein HETIRDRAFT_417520 [Heterobasidion irregulare TC 32-1]